MIRSTVLIMSAGIFVILQVLLCASAFADQRFKDNGDGTITDRHLGVMWAKTDNGKDIDWEQARKYAKSKFKYTNYGNWRLPTLEELHSLYEHRGKNRGYKTGCGLIVKLDPVFRLSCVLIWASDTALGAQMAYNFNIGSSFTVPSYDQTGCRVLPVRTIK